MSLSKFQESILVLSALKNNMQNDLKVFKRYIKDEDLKYSLHIKMIIDVASFLDEWKRLNAYVKENEDLKETMRIVSPAIKRIAKWKDITAMRNTMLAHGFRDEKYEGKLTCLDRRFFNANVPTTYAEIMLLAEYAVYAISAVICRHKKDHEVALASAPKYEEDVVRGIQTMDEFNQDVVALQQHMFSIDSSLKGCFGA